MIEKRRRVSINTDTLYGAVVGASVTVVLSRCPIILCIILVLSVTAIGVNGRDTINSKNIF